MDHINNRVLKHCDLNIIISGDVYRIKIKFDLFGLQ